MAATTERGTAKATTGGDLRVALRAGGKGKVVEGLTVADGGSTCDGSPGVATAVAGRQQASEWVYREKKPLTAEREFGRRYYIPRVVLHLQIKLHFRGNVWDRSV
jgi:hypothetical protein